MRNLELEDENWNLTLPEILRSPWRMPYMQTKSKPQPTDLTQGRHWNPTNKPAYFTTAYFHRPEEFAAEVSDVGFSDIQILAIEGPAWSTALFRDAWNDSEQRGKLLEFLSLIESEPSLRGASAHVMAVGFKPN
jgi:hypothetical protein